MAPIESPSRFAEDSNRASNVPVTVEYAGTLKAIVDD